jgi:hypothetical protein
VNSNFFDSHEVEDDVFAITDVATVVLRDRGNACAEKNDLKKHIPDPAQFRGRQVRVQV